MAAAVIAPYVVGAIIYFILSNDPRDSPRQVAGNALDAVIFTVGSGTGAGGIILSSLRVGLSKFAGCLTRQYIGTGQIDVIQAFKEGRNVALFYGGIRIFGVVWKWLFKTKPDGTVTMDISTKGRTIAEANALKEYARRTNKWLRQKGPQTIHSTAGGLRNAANAAARLERARAAKAGIPYKGQVGYVPDTAISGEAIPPAGWLDMPGVSNQVAGGGLSKIIGKKLRLITVDGKEI